VHPIPTDGEPESDARVYEGLLKRTYGSETLDPARPLFDLMLLGLGEDGHICSLFPGQPTLAETRRWVIPAPKGRPEVRLTLTFPCVQSARTTAFLVSGASKADAVRGVRAGDKSLPGGILKPQGELVWLMDGAAAGLS